MTHHTTGTDTTTPVAASATAPVAETRPVQRTHHGITVTDDFDWLRDKDSDDVLAHLHAENAYTESLTADQQPLREAIFAEIKSHTVETDLSVPSRRDGWWYFSRTEEGQQYAIHCRVPASDTGDAEADWTPPVIERGVALDGEEVIFDANREAEGTAFFALGGLAVSRDGTLLAYAVDTTGDERFTLRVRRLDTGEELGDVVENVSYGLAFDPTGERIFYMVPDDTWRPYQLWTLNLGGESELLHQEDDPGFWTGFDLSAERDQLVIGSGNSEVAETWILDLTDPTARPERLVSREHQMLHSIDPVRLDGAPHYLVTHDRDLATQNPAPNNMVSVVAAEQITDPSAWHTVLPHSPTVKIDGVHPNRTHLMIAARADTTPRTLILPLSELPAERSAGHPCPTEPRFGEELYSAELASAPFDSPFIRLAYSSWVTPDQVLDYALATGETLLRRATEVPGYDPNQYLVERWWAPAESTDRRVAIPLTVIRHRDVEWNGSNPCVVYGYGSYEASMDPGFAASRLSLLDRGVVYVVAHVRGGGELGRAWYDQGKKLHKKNTFTDFVDATRFVASSGWVDPDRIGCMGGSAGGLLMGAVLNLAPELYRVCVAQVPFVDALTSILDPDLPLSALEWEEWGNPIADEQVYRYMAEYTPYENVRAVNYPAIAAMTSLHDTRVLYVEPAKWVQQLRRTVTSDQATALRDGGSPVVLRTEMDGGHGGASGRYRSWEERAWEYAFLLTGLGLDVEH
ncbi:S9 family peptidase [Citricoccus sp. NR2]|uniref:S9 family peptidase n=1 Tax=Citricoccus sp. NR2 TaxID=3004095 RepID=UPI0022DE001D|nr:S9 family peptidase [Citricoccus sp. NR2]WBL20489.1 S9 family peptidase [Citricoccus sp. NR2]